MQFKRKPIEIYKEALSMAEAEAETKLNLLEDCRQEALKYCDIDDLKAFSNDMISYTTKTIVNKNKAFKTLHISDSKILDLLEIDLKQLAYLEAKYNSNKTLVNFNEKNEASTKVSKNDFIWWTQNQVENDKLEAIENFKIALKKLEKYTRIYKGNIAGLTGNLLIGDIRSNEVKVNKQIFSPRLT